MVPNPYESPNGAEGLPEPVESWPPEYGQYIVLATFAVYVIAFTALVLFAEM
jgi:hypothetical protein